MCSTIVIKNDSINNMNPKYHNTMPAPLRHMVTY